MYKTLEIDFLSFYSKNCLLIKLHQVFLTARLLYLFMSWLSLAHLSLQYKRPIVLQVL